MNGGELLCFKAEPLILVKDKYLEKHLLEMEKIE